MKTSSSKRKWTPTVMCKRPDNLISSEFTGQQKKFITSYEKEEVNMNWLMANEYSRIWFREKDSIKQMVLSAVDQDFLVRRYVIRGLLLKRKEEEKKKPFKMKKFEAISSKIKIRTKEEIDKMMSKLTEKEREELLAEAKGGNKTSAELKSEHKKDQGESNKAQEAESNKPTDNKVDAGKEANSPEKSNPTASGSEK